jgi:hypothetical protein
VTSERLREDRRRSNFHAVAVRDQLSSPSYRSFHRGVALNDGGSCFRLFCLQSIAGVGFAYVHLVTISKACAKKLMERTSRSTNLFLILLIFLIFQRLFLLLQQHHD